MDQVGINKNTISDCTNSSAVGYLGKDKAEQAWNVVALRINNWRYSGALDAETVGTFQNIFLMTCLNYVLKFIFIF